MRVMLRMEIFFETDKEVVCFCETLFHENKQIAVHWQLSEKWGNQLTIQSEPLNELAFQAVAKSLVHVYITFHLRSVLSEIIQHTYYFTERHEVEKIYDYAEWIVTGEDADSKLIRKNKHPIQLLRAIFIMHLRNAKKVYFTSIIKFGMKAFKHDLIDYVGLAIDEVKREEEYQTFVNMLREYILKKEPITSSVYVVEGDEFSYYREDGTKWSAYEIRQAMKKTPLYLLGFPAEEWNLAPLIALAPEIIYFYVDDPASAKSQTILNVFQERVQLRFIEEFPFTYSLYSSYEKTNRKR
jgi:putative sporulation protein YtxC